MKASGLPSEAVGQYQERMCRMGDKGGKKDKEKSQKQKNDKDKQKKKQKQDNAPKRVP